MCVIYVCVVIIATTFLFFYVCLFYVFFCVYMRVREL